MNKKNWLIAGLSLVMAASLGVGISACGDEKNPAPPPHTHAYTEWQHTETEHWKICPDDGAVDPAGKSAHNFVDGNCECGVQEEEEHTHAFTEWRHDETEHWMVCPDDGEIWAQGKAAHDFTNGDCVCGAKKPAETHTCTYDAWDWDDTQHWKYCDEHGTDKSHIDESTRADHHFVEGVCECGATEPTPPAVQLDNREFWVTGSGAGDLKNCSWEELKDTFKLTKEPQADAEGFTLYTIQFKIYAGGDNFKIRQDERNDMGGLVWTDGTYFGLSEIRGNDGTFVDAGNFNIGVAKGKDGIYKFTVHTKPAPADWADNYVSFELVQAVEPLAQTEDIYIVGPLKQYPTNAWPSAAKNGVEKDCVHLEFDGEKTWSATVRLQTVDAWKLYNAVNGKYIPDPGENVKVTKNGDWKISWVVGTNTVKMEAVAHTHYYNVDGHDTEQHYKQCWLDSEIDASSREDHVYDNDQDATCNTCGFERHVHKYTEWGKNETQHWMQCPDDGTIDDSTKADHVYDQEGNKCICGQEQGETCKHDGRINFKYTASDAPAIQADGGTLHGTCGICGEEVDVAYDVGVEKFSKFSVSSQVVPTVLEVGKKYYGETATNRSGFIGVSFGLKVPEGAGSLVIKFYTIVEGSTDVKVPANLGGIAISDQNYLESGLKVQTTNPEGDVNAPYFFIYQNKYMTEEAQTKWQDRITSDCINPAGTDTGTKASGRLAMTSVSVSYTAEDTDRYFYCELETRTGTRVLIDVDFVPAAAAAVVAPQEVAMLPDGKNN